MSLALSACLIVRNEERAMARASLTSPDVTTSPRRATSPPDWPLSHTSSRWTPMSSSLPTVCLPWPLTAAPRHRSSVMELGHASRIADIHMTFEHCLALGGPDPARYETVPGVGSYRAAYNLGIFHESRGDVARARAFFERAAADGYTPAAERLRTL